MFIQLTNASPLHRGRPLLLRADIILTVYEGIAVREDGSVDDPVTFIFSPDHGTWEVVDSVEDVLQKLHAAEELALQNAVI
jgi:hypothetical protein